MIVWDIPSRFHYCRRITEIYVNVLDFLSVTEIFFQLSEWVSLVLCCGVVCCTAVQLQSCILSIALYKPCTLLILTQLMCITFFKLLPFCIFLDSSPCGLTVEKVGNTWTFILCNVECVRFTCLRSSHLFLSSVSASVISAYLIGIIISVSAHACLAGVHRHA